MKNERKDLTSGNLWKQILVFSFPLMISNLLQVLFNIADVAVVGRFAGPIALGAVGSTTTLITLFTGILIGVSSGINVLVALAIGSKSEKDIKETVHTSAMISTILGTVLMIFGIFSAQGILELLHTKNELLDGAVSYLHIYYCGIPAMAMYNFGNAVLSAAGDTKRPLKYLTCSGIINIVLNLLFVVGCKLDVQGVAIASIIAQYTSAILIIRALFVSTEMYGLCLKDMKLSKDKASRLLQIGVPAGLQGAIFCIANLFVQMGVNSFDAVMVAGNSAAANSDSIIYDIMAAFYTACGSFMGQNLGARKKDRVWKSYTISLFYSFAIGLVLGLLLVAFGPQFLSMFTTEPAVVMAGMERITIMGFSYCISAFMDSTIAASRGLGKTVVPMIIVILGSCVFRVIWVYTIFAYFKTSTSLYLLYVFSWSITALAELIYFIKEYKKTVETM